MAVILKIFDKLKTVRSNPYLFADIELEYDFDIYQETILCR